MSVLRDLQMGRARIASGFCHRNFAQDVNGNRCDPDDPNAARWCARGAVGSDGHAFLNFAAEKVLAAALPEEDGRYLAYGTNGDGNRVALYNNTHTQEEVLALFDRAIAAQRRPTQELVSELMERVMGERIPEDA
jgi:hypothetical protein